MNLKMLSVLAAFILLTACAGKTPQLGVEDEKLMKCPATPNCVNSQIAGNEHFIEPMVSDKAQFETKKQLLKILNSVKNAEVTKVTNDYIRVEFVSSVFRFVDDVEFYFPVTTDNVVIIHVRSASRLGRSDFGVNRNRIEGIRKQLSLSDS